MYGAALKNGAGGDGKQEYFCKMPYIKFDLEIMPVFLHLFHLVEHMSYHKFGKNRTKVKVIKSRNYFFL